LTPLSALIAAPPSASLSSETLSGALFPSLQVPPSARFFCRTAVGTCRKCLSSCMRLAASAGAGALAAPGPGLHFVPCIGSLRQRLPDFVWERMPGGRSAGFAIPPRARASRGRTRVLYWPRMRINSLPGTLPSAASACAHFLSLQAFSGPRNLLFLAKQLPHSCSCSRRVPSCISRPAARTIEVHVTTVCSRLCPAALCSCLLRLLTLKNDESTRETAPSQLQLLSQGSWLLIQTCGKDHRSQWDESVQQAVPCCALLVSLTAPDPRKWRA